MNYSGNFLQNQIQDNTRQMFSLNQSYSINAALSMAPQWDANNEIKSYNGEKDDVSSCTNSGGEEVESPPRNILSSEEIKTEANTSSSSGDLDVKSVKSNVTDEESDTSPKTSRSKKSQQESKMVKVDTPDGTRTYQKPCHSIITLISKAILSSREKKMLLGDIYEYIMDTFPYFKHVSDKAWRNSIRHNLSLNECFVKSARSENGKGHFWAIHPACLEDFEKGDFRRRHARRRARRGQSGFMGAFQGQYPSNTTYPGGCQTSGYVPMTQMTVSTPVGPATAPVSQANTLTPSNEFSSCNNGLSEELYAAPPSGYIHTSGDQRGFHDMVPSHNYHHQPTHYMPTPPSTTNREMLSSSLTANSCMPAASHYFSHYLGGMTASQLSWLMSGPTTGQALLDAMYGSLSSH